MPSFAIIEERPGDVNYPMMTRLDVESAIKQLPESEVRDLAKWLQDYLDEMWDRKIEADLASGKGCISMHAITSDNPPLPLRWRGFFKYFPSIGGVRDSAGWVQTCLTSDAPQEN